jgi:hypothetical protein
MWVPPYFGSWDELVQALLHNPFLGSDPEPPHPHSLMMRNFGPAGKHPAPAPWAEASPWRSAVAGFAAAVNVQVLASHVRDEAVRQQMAQSAERAIADLLDEWCGTPWRWPWPWPGPPPWVLGIASELNGIASSLPEGEMRSGLQALAGQVAAKGFGAAARETG